MRNDAAMLLRWRAGRKGDGMRCRWNVLNVSRSVHVILRVIRGLANARPVSPSASYFFKSQKVTKRPCSWFGPRSSGALTPATLRGPVANGPSMAQCGSRGIHAARPTARRLRSACTQVAIGGVWAIAYDDQDQRQRQRRTLVGAGFEVRTDRYQAHGSMPRRGNDQIQLSLPDAAPLWERIHSRKIFQTIEMY